jgi:hypothetical protein
MAEKEIAVQFDVITQELVERELTSEEVADRKIIKDEFEAEQKAKESRIAARESALAKLAKLGLTEEEIASL